MRGLLAKVHQSKQKNLQNSISTRLQEQTQKEEEARALEDKMRYLTFENSLQNDMEIAIEKAANQLSLAYHQVHLCHVCFLQASWTYTLEFAQLVFVLT